MVNNIEFNIVKFNEEIEILCSKGVDYLDSIITWCHRNDIELETIVPILKKDVTIKARLQKIAITKNLLKKVIDNV